MRLSEINREQILRSEEIDFEYFRSSGPGGQNVNKVATAVRLRFDVARAQWLPEDVKSRLARLAGSRMTERGEILIEAQRFRTQESNREDAVERLIRLIVRAWHKPRRRVPTRPTAGSEERRLDSKKRRGRIKRERGGGRNPEA
ncbi:MAG: aminoacyl-tRNA hydrolase [Syntrophobacteraceae bacterium]|jgi:ribosome-associated protein|nr:aminoacyl-tRNA hydrolase [Syntrophobacteraceae bacterium]